MSWNIYCCICGISCNSITIDNLIEEFEVNNGEECTNDVIKEIKNIVNKMKWCKSSIALFSNNKNKRYYNYQVDDEDFITSKNDNNDYAICIHYNCWNYIKITHGIELHYNNLPINYINKKKEIGEPPLMNINYGEIKKYWSQYMNFYKMYIDKNTYMLENPLIDVNVKNINRIKKIISQLKLKKELRPSPSISATFYKINTIKLGNNNKFWVVKNNKWFQINEDCIKQKINISVKNKFYNKIINIPRIGEYNNIPLFISNITSNKKEKCIEIIATSQTINILDNYTKNT
jgi:hypothetical protein